jgi:PhzF family phenazine biosynthesis protein
MEVLRIAAFCDGSDGGNPAGVVLVDALPPASLMQAIAAEIGYSETAFVEPNGDRWGVRYFSPETEVPFCGHATIAIGAALAMKHGEGTHHLRLSESELTVEGRRDGSMFVGALQSPPTRSTPADPRLVSQTLSLFGYSADDLDPSIPPAIAEAGAVHLVLSLTTRRKLASMAYDFDAGGKLMITRGLVTIAFVHTETPQLFHARNAFASGGVYEDPATGAAAAALAGYLRDLDWPHDGRIDIVQGEDMHARSRLQANISSTPGDSIRVSGTARLMAG